MLLGFRAIFDALFFFFFELFVREESTDLSEEAESLLEVLILLFRKIGRGEELFLLVAEPEGTRGDKEGFESLSVTVALPENRRAEEERPLDVGKVLLEGTAERGDGLAVTVNDDGFGGRYAVVERLTGG